MGESIVVVGVSVVDGAEVEVVGESIVVEGVSMVDGAEVEVVGESIVVEGVSMVDGAEVEVVGESIVAEGPAVVLGAAVVDAAAVVVALAGGLEGVATVVGDGDVAEVVPVRDVTEDGALVTDDNTATELDATVPAGSCWPATVLVVEVVMVVGPASDHVSDAEADALGRPVRPSSSDAVRDRTTT